MTSKEKRLEDLKAGGATCADVLPEFIVKHVRIGFLRGSGFVYCNIVDDNTVAMIRKEQESILSEMTKQATLVRNDIVYLKRIGLAGYITKEVNRERKAYENKTFGHGRGFIPSSAEQIEKKYLKRLDYQQRYMEMYEQLVKAKDFILGAKYLTSYASVDVEAPDTVIIILEGSVKGRYWMEKEYLSGIVESEEGEE